jgi:hypothetical protein
MTEENPKDEAQKDKDRIRKRNPEWERLEEFVKKIAQVPKQELDEKRAEYKRKKK